MGTRPTLYAVNRERRGFLREVWLGGLTATSITLVGCSLKKESQPESLRKLFSHVQKSVEQLSSKLDDLRDDIEALRKGYRDWLDAVNDVELSFASVKGAQGELEDAVNSLDRELESEE